MLALATLIAVGPCVSVALPSTRIGSFQDAPQEAAAQQGAVEKAAPNEAPQRPEPVKETIRGRILGPDGKGIFGAKVRVLHTKKSRKVDPRGKVSLKGSFLPDLVAVLELPEGEYRAMALPARDRSTGERDEFEWRPLAPFTPRPAPSVDREQEMAWAKELLMPFVEKASIDVNEVLLLDVIDGLVRIDPQLAVHLIQEDVFEQDFVAEYALERTVQALAKSSPREALQILDDVEPSRSRSKILLSVARVLGGDDEVELLTAHLNELESLPTVGGYLISMAELARRFLDLGDAERAKEILTRAAAEAESPDANRKKDRLDHYAWSLYGEVLAEIDFEAGLPRVEAGHEANLPRHYGNLAHRLAAKDPERAASLIEKIRDLDQFWPLLQWVPPVVYRMGASDPDLALRVADRDDLSGYSFAMLALSLHEQGKVESIPKLLDRAIDRCFDPRREFSMRQTDDASRGGAILRVAYLVDRESFPRYLGRALSFHRAHGADQINKDMQRLEECVIANFVVDIDADLAAALIEPALDAHFVHLAKHGQAVRLTGGRGLWAALAQLDPERAVELAKQFGGAEAVVVATVLATRPLDRLAFIRREYGQQWAPEGAGL